MRMVHPALPNSETDVSTRAFHVVWSGLGWVDASKRKPRRTTPDERDTALETPKE